MFTRFTIFWALLMLVPGLAWATNLTNRPLIHLTFDDGPHPTRTPRLLSVLKQAHVKATFFVTGENCRKHPAVLKQIVMAGHSLGNHTTNHPKLTTLTSEQIKAELVDTQAAVDHALLSASALQKGKHFPLRTFRPPYGAVDGKVRAVASSILTPAGLNLQKRGKLPEGAGQTKVVIWNVDSNDWRKQGVEAVMGNVFPAVYSNANTSKILLFHDIHAQTVDEYFPAVLQRLVTEGFKIERIDRVKGYIGL